MPRRATPVAWRGFLLGAVFARHADPIDAQRHAARRFFYLAPRFEPATVAENSPIRQGQEPLAVRCRLTRFLLGYAALFGN